MPILSKNTQVFNDKAKYRTAIPLLIIVVRNLAATDHYVCTKLKLPCYLFIKQ